MDAYRVDPRGRGIYGVIVVELMLSSPDMHLLTQRNNIHVPETDRQLKSTESIARWAKCVDNHRGVQRFAQTGSVG